MEKTVINANKRVVKGKGVGQLRRSGILPGVLYGHKFESTPIEMNQREASNILRNVSQSKIVTINLEGKEVATLVRERQKDYIRNEYTHVDFQVVSMTEKIKTMVSIILHGISPAVKNYNGVVFNETNAVEVEALPADLPENIVVDISALEEIGDQVLVKDLKVSDKVTIHNDPEEVIVVITAGAEELTDIVDTTGELAEPEVIERGKKDEDIEDDSK